jgi:hypothetical protein
VLKKTKHEKCTMEELRVNIQRTVDRISEGTLKKCSTRRSVVYTYWQNIMANAFINSLYALSVGYASVSHTFNHFKMVEVQICEMSLVKQCVWIACVRVAFVCHVYIAYYLWLM